MPQQHSCSNSHAAETTSPGPMCDDHNAIGVSGATCTGVARDDRMTQDTTTILLYHGPTGGADPATHSSSDSHNTHHQVV